MYENMTVSEIKEAMIEEARLELNGEITQEKRLEILKLHNVLVERRLKIQQPDLAIRNRMYRIYKILVTEYNIELCYNLPIRVFIKEFYNCELEGITK